LARGECTIESAGTPSKKPSQKPTYGVAIALSLILVVEFGATGDGGTLADRATGFGRLSLTIVVPARSQPVLVFSSHSSSPKPSANGDVVEP